MKEELIKLANELSEYKEHPTEKKHRFYHLIRTLNIKIHPGLVIDGFVDPFLFRWSSTYYELLNGCNEVKNNDIELDDFWTTL